MNPKFEYVIKKVVGELTEYSKEQIESSNFKTELSEGEGGEGMHPDYMTEMDLDEGNENAMTMVINAVARDMFATAKKMGVKPAIHNQDSGGGSTKHKGGTNFNIYPRASQGRLSFEVQIEGVDANQFKEKIYDELLNDYKNKVEKLGGENGINVEGEYEGGLTGTLIFKQAHGKGGDESAKGEEKLKRKRLGLKTD